MNVINVGICGKGIERLLLEKYSMGYELPSGYEELKSELLKLSNMFPDEMIEVEQIYIEGRVRTHRIS